MNRAVVRASSWASQVFMLHRIWSDGVRVVDWVVSGWKVSMYEEVNWPGGRLERMN